MSDLPAVPAPTPPSGAFGRDGAHLFPIRVFYEDTDAAGIVYFANYLKFAERARSELIRLAGLSHGSLAAEERALFIVRRVEVDYRAPARLEDALLVETRLVEFGGARFVLDQDVVRPAPGAALGPQGGEAQRLVQMRVTLACVNDRGRPVRLPASVAAALGRLPAVPAPSQPLSPAHPAPAGKKPAP